MDVTVSLDGTRRRDVEDNLNRLVITDGAGTADDSARLIVSASPDLLSEIPPRTLISFGAGGVQLGPTCRVTSMGWDERGGTVNINATAVDHDAPLREPRDADWTGQSLGAIAGRIADRSGLTAAVAAELRSVQPDGAVQAGEADRAFIGRIAGAAGGEVVVKDGHLIVLVAGQALSAGSALPLDTIEIDASTGEVWLSGLVSLPLFRSVVARWQTVDGETGDEQAGSGAPVRRLSTVYGTPALAAGAAQRALATIQGQSIEVLVTGPIRPDVRPLHPLRIVRSRVPILHGAELRVDDVTHSVSAFGASTTVFRGLSTP